MKKSGLYVLLAAIVLPLLLAASAAAAQVWIVDILANPARYWNMTVTLVGQVQNVAANPAGTTRGTFTLLDESCPNPIMVRTNELPPVGKSYSVTGIIIQDPAAAGAPLLKEVSRSSPGMASTTLYILIGAGAVFLILLVVFIVMLSKPKQKAAAPAETIRPRPQDTIHPAVRPMAPAPGYADAGKTAKMPSGPAPSFAGPSADKTQVYMNLGASILIDRGPDRGKEFPLHKPVMTIGRPGARKNDIELADDTVSKDQASIYFDNTRKTFSIANESSTNPTMVNGQPVSGPTLVENDTVIEMGRTVLRFKKT
jgi:hypothetical protein